MKNCLFRLSAIVSIMLGVLVIPSIASAKDVAATSRTYSTVTGQEILPSCNVDYKLAKGVYNCELVLPVYIPPRGINEGADVVVFVVTGIGNFRLNKEGAKFFVDGRLLKSNVVSVQYKRLPEKRMATVVTVFLSEPIMPIPVRTGKGGTIVASVRINERTTMMDFGNIGFYRKK